MRNPVDRDTLRDGYAAETAACQHLEGKGLLLIERNYRCSFGEIDLIMRDDETLVFVEVRRRRNVSFGTPAETVGPRKQKRLRASAEHYLQRHATLSQNPCRFDIVAITNDRSADIEWLRNAF